MYLESIDLIHGGFYDSNFNLFFYTSRCLEIPWYIHVVIDNSDIFEMLQKVQFCNSCYNVVFPYVFELSCFEMK